MYKSPLTYAAQGYMIAFGLGMVLWVIAAILVFFRM